MTSPDFPRFITDEDLEQITTCDGIFDREVEMRLAFSLWSAHLEWLQACGFKRASQRVATSAALPSTQHDVVDMLNAYVAQTGLGNAHFGLTSSDIIDNVRLMQLRHAIEEVIKPLFGAVCDKVVALVPPLDRQTAKGWTHWQQAQSLSWRHRVQAWARPLMLRTGAAPHVFAKHFGGATGEAAEMRRLFPSMNLIPFDWSEFGLRPPAHKTPIQSSDHTCELEALAWMASAMAQVHKIAADLRFLYSHGEVNVSVPLSVGSSSMPHKRNPFLLEKTCSVARYVANRQLDVWQVAAHNGLERTLDTSWQLSHVLVETCTAVEKALRAFLKSEITIVGSSVEEVQRGNSESALIHEVCSTPEQTRWDLFCSKVLNKL